MAEIVFHFSVLTLRMFGRNVVAARNSILYLFKLISFANLPSRSDSSPHSLCCLLLLACCLHCTCSVITRGTKNISGIFPASLPSSFPYVVITINHRHYKDKSHPSSLPSFLPCLSPLVPQYTALCVHPSSRCSHDTICAWSRIRLLAGTCPNGFGDT